MSDSHDNADSLLTAGAIQYETANKNMHKIGDLDHTDIISGTDWIMLEYEGGDVYGSHCGGEARRTKIMITCAPGVTTLNVVRFLGEEKNKSSDCTYMFELSHNSACSVTQPGLSIGSIICIVFVSLVAVYLIGGTLYMRFIAGAKGVEQMPHYHFWQDFGNLQADGCDLVCRCGRQTNKRSYRGVGDDQLTSGHEDEDERQHFHEHDDSLLPM